jgi:hypothetical protein
MVWVRSEPTYMNEEAMDDDSRTPDGHTDRHHLVLCPNFVKIWSQGPGSCISVVGLDICSAPGSVSIAINKKRLVSGYDRHHDGVADEATQQGAIYLGEEHDTGRDLDYVNWSAFSCDRTTNRKDQSHGIHPSSSHCKGWPHWQRQCATKRQNTCCPLADREVRGQPASLTECWSLCHCRI